MRLNLTWHDVVWMYECHLLVDSGYYLKSRFSIVRLVSHISKSNKGMKDDYLITSGEWHNGLHYPTREESQVGYLRFRSFNMGTSSLVLLLSPFL